MSVEMPPPFGVRIGVRSYEMDVNGHVNHAVYHQYGEHARMEHFRAAGLSQHALGAHGLTIVLLSTTCLLYTSAVGREVQQLVEGRLETRRGQGVDLATHGEHGQATAR